MSGAIVEDPIEAFNKIESPTHTGLLLPAVTDGNEAKMEIFLLLSGDVYAGLLATIRILYPVPAVVPTGIVPVMLPYVVAFTEPMATGVAKLPLASDNCNVKVLPARNGKLVV